MEYVCTDRGTSKCPCALMAAGQCYTCGMLSRGKCDCRAGWQGVCPYNEYVQNGGKAQPVPAGRALKIRKVEDFSDRLKVLTLEAPLGLALACSRMGSFVLAGEGELSLPLSVMEAVLAGTDAELAGAEAESGACIRLCLDVTGPKSQALDRSAESGGRLWIRGPFSSGLINAEKYDPHRLSLVIGRGMAIMPLLNQKNLLGSGLLAMYLDENKLTADFLARYAAPLAYRQVKLDESAAGTAAAGGACGSGGGDSGVCGNDGGDSGVCGTDELVALVRGDIEYCLQQTGLAPNIFFMLSPYYCLLLAERFDLDLAQVIYPNHANMCCGLGLCGACSHTDADGVTVRACKCSEIPQ